MKEIHQKTSVLDQLGLSLSEPATTLTKGMKLGGIEQFGVGRL